MASYLLSKQECEVSSNVLPYLVVPTSLKKARSALLQGLSLWLPQDDDGAGIDLQQVNTLCGSHEPMIDHVFTRFRHTNHK